MLLIRDNLFLNYRRDYIDQLYKTHIQKANRTISKYRQDKVLREAEEKQ